MQNKSTRYALSVMLAFTLLGCESAQTEGYHAMGSAVNDFVSYPVHWSATVLNCDVATTEPQGEIHPDIFGTNLEWFNDAGGIAGQDEALKQRIATLAREQGVRVMRYPGGTLADFYHWRDGIGPIQHRHLTKHPTDPGTSSNRFGTPEFYRFLQATHSHGLITVNAGTGSASEAADWVAYANRPQHALRMQDGLQTPMNIKLWEIGNELYLPGNPGEQIITVTPEVYAQRYLAFSRAMKAVDPSIKTLAIGVALAHTGPATQYPQWSEVLLKNAGAEIDMIAVHNAYFPVLYKERQPHVLDVYPALWAAPEAVDQSLTHLEQLMDRYQPGRNIGIAITEWGMLFSNPDVDNYWLDHVKTLGSGIYAARMLQVMMSHPRVQLANYFKLVDRSYMGWINYEGKPKVPYWVFSLYANHSGTQRLATTLNSPTYDAKQIGTILPQKQVPEVTVVSSINRDSGKIYINLLNRSVSTGYPVKINLKHLVNKPGKVTLLSISAKEVTAHNGRDIPPEWPYGKAIEPYSTAHEDSIGIQQKAWHLDQPVALPPFSVATLVVEIDQPH